MNLEKMKKQCGDLDGIYCKLTKENYDLLISSGFKQWDGESENDSIYVIDKEDDQNEFIALGQEEEKNYKEFVFLNNEPLFKE